MKTLFERLSLENQDAILLKQVEHSATWTPIYGKLVGTFTWSKLTLEEAMTIQFELFTGGFNLDTFINLFEEDES
mgnify:CR=1 FL=1|tara:strand:- start:596 stop:820 length:225 start_codon:yes stop_codon:yes gene_type:complete